MPFAIIRSGGKQIRVEEGATIRVPVVDTKVGESVELEALLISGSDGLKIADAGPVKASIIAHGRGEKIIVFKKKRRKQYKRTKGHRQNFTTIRIDSIG